MIDEVSVVGIGYRAFSYYHDGTIVYDDSLPGGSAQVGLAVTLAATALTVSLVGDGEQVEGRIVKVEPDGIVVVQNGGVTEFQGGNGATLTPGTRIVGALNASAEEGYIRSVASVTAAEVAVGRGEIVDASDATAVQVLL